MRFLPPAEDLYLDFDGVLCDSLEECYRSSWMAATGYRVGPELPPEVPFDRTYRSRFDACRPFIRSGEDYLMVHRWAALGRVPQSQKDFDQSLVEVGANQLAHWKRSLYEVREGLLAHHRALWLSWNPLYPGMAAALAGQVANPAVWILSTKKAEFIVEILGHHGVPWPLTRTLYTGTRRKLDIIGERSGTRGAILIDDQFDHLDFSHDRYQCFLALWGYVAPTADRTQSSLTLGQALEVIRGFPRLPHAE